MSQRTITIATWNCFGMAQNAYHALAAGRAPYGERLRDPEVIRAFDDVDIVCVQEILSRDAEVFFDALGAVRIRDKNRVHLRPLTLRGSGLGIAGRFSIVSSRTQAFSQQGAGWDRFARKGLLHARVDLDGAAIDVVNVHLQSGYGRNHVAIRATQLAEVSRCVEQVGSDDRWFIACGDFNVCGLSSSGDDYQRLCATLSGFVDVGARDGFATFDPDLEQNCLAHRLEPRSPRQRIDYIFVRPPREGRLHIDRVVRALDEPLSATPAPHGLRHAFASDHFAVIATLAMAR